MTNFLTKTPFAAFCLSTLLATQGYSETTCRSSLLTSPSPLTTMDSTAISIPNNPISRRSFQATSKWELFSLFQTVEHFYGPLEIKDKTIGLDWEQLKRKTLKSVDRAETSNDQYFIIADLLHSFNDAHVSIKLPSTLSFKLPLQMSFVENKIVVNYVDPSFPTTVRSPELGDQLLSINGMSPDQFQKTSPAFNALGNELTSKNFFARVFSNLKEASGIPLSKWNFDEVALKFQPYDSQQAPYEIRLKFEKSGVGLIGKDVQGVNTGVPVILGARPSTEKKALAMAHHSPGTHRIFTLANHLLRTEVKQVKQSLGADPSEPLAPTQRKGKGARQIMGNQKPIFKLPADFKRIEIPALKNNEGFDLQKDFNNNFFFAGTFEHNGKRVGLLRIPSYEPDNEDNMLHSLRYFIHRLKAESDYLIIDQLSNPGGLVLLSDFFIKMLVGQYDLSKHLRFAVKPSQGFMREYAEMKMEVERNSDGLFTPDEVHYFSQKFDLEYQKIQRAYDQGLSHSEPISMTAMSEYMELSMDRMALKKGPLTKDLIDNVLKVDVTQPVVYTQPVFFLINEFDFSGGDATPASLQDYGRVTLIGNRTAGAGGTVEEFNQRMQSEINFHLTTSLMYRKGDRLVENFGVQPDILLPVLTSDYVDEFSNYFNRVLRVVEQKLSLSARPN